ncbi:hypothetical protein ACI2KS_10360 [Pseudomonas sp. NPDC087358]|uniref:hypothetical protein n=1 Tax=Pseudomonas sp. NPDC087358 TaxID=3364439 RepID=UPI00384ECC1D
MSKFFVCPAASGTELNLFDGATGEIVSTKTMPFSASSGALFDMSYDGTIAAVTFYLQGYVWFWNQATGQTSQIQAGTYVGAGHGFDGEGTFYLGASEQYLKVVAPYTAGSFVAAPGVGAIYPGQLPERALCLSGGGLARMDLTTGAVGTVIGEGEEIGPAVADTSGSYAISCIDYRYGAKIRNYDTGVTVAQIGPTSGASAADIRGMPYFTSDGSGYVLKISEGALGLGLLGATSVRPIPLDAVIDYAADLAYVYLEGLLDDNTVLLSSVAIRNMLVAFDLTTQQIVWQNSNGRNVSQSGSDAKGCGVQPTFGPGGNPPEPAGFWKELLLAYEAA